MFGSSVRWSRMSRWRRLPASPKAARRSGRSSRATSRWRRSSTCRLSSAVPPSGPARTLSTGPAHHCLCSIHPSAGALALAALEAEAPDLVPRVTEFKANGSPLRTDELIRLDHPTADPPTEFAEELASLHNPDGLQILGGCCGTDNSHMRALAGLLTGLD